MERLTWSKNNYVGLVYDENEPGWEETAKKLMYRLAKYEDEAERRDDGCDMCKDIASDVPGVCRMDTLYMVYYDYAGESHDLSAEPPNYCPFCGRKLVE